MKVITLTQLAHKENVTRIRVKRDSYDWPIGDVEIELHSGDRLVYAGLADGDEVREFVENHSK